MGSRGEQIVKAEIAELKAMVIAYNSGDVIDGDLRRFQTLFLKYYTYLSPEQQNAGEAFIEANKHMFYYDTEKKENSKLFMVIVCIIFLLVFSFVLYHNIY